MDTNQPMRALEGEASMEMTTALWLACASMQRSLPFVIDLGSQAMGSRSLYRMVPRLV
jgi:hypothetical protein